MPLPDFLQISYRPELDLLVGRWQRIVSEGELYASYPALLEEAVARGCRYWLLDARRRLNIEVAITPWLLNDFVPRLGQHLGGRAYLAYLVAPVQLTDAVPADKQIPPLVYFEGRAALMQRFTDEATALAWLQEQRASGGDN
ncbi:hypothetical protein EJV47_16460 [Hymenobacter gummosus]|uniref:STAS/SEC14 domain-containing protein n=1 Tax=Hymenobacter gummosus TaxID=1776032 RepID=A0A431U102_9BACT|nr:hypothetical protein [Hymenobacter gummosus]RTQ48564.1 hypothetical protein EJV47_16460 [Hymenobacter gummosus]